jgi:hypothetical protein
MSQSSNICVGHNELNVEGNDDASLEVAEGVGGFEASREVTQMG